MLPVHLQIEQFSAYPPEARTLVAAHLDALRNLPISFLPGILREVIDFDVKFPAERAAIDKEFANLSSLSPSQFADWFQTFSQFHLSPQLEHFDWVNRPGQFVEQLSAYLWTTGQLDAYRQAATAYGDRLRAVSTPDPLPVRRLGIAVIGQGVAAYDEPLFRNLREQGTYFTRVKPEKGLGLLLDAVAARATAHPVRYAHWYVDGGQAADHIPLLTCVSYQALEPLRSALLKNIQTEIARPGMGPEELRTHMARLSPADLGMETVADPTLNSFILKLFTEGSGTQIFSTTFAQWTAREALRRAQPLTLLVRFAPRQRQRPMNELMSSSNSNPEFDPIGSLIDADMAAYYQWVNQQRLPGYDQSSFLVWFEEHRQALVVGPSLPRGTESNSAVDLRELVSLSAG
jgi:hypothetical protein